MNQILQSSLIIFMKLTIRLGTAELFLTACLTEDGDTRAWASLSILILYLITIEDIFFHKRNA